MSVDIFPDVRFNGCLGNLEVSSDALIFADDTLGIKLSWTLDTLEEEVLRPATFSVDLAFNLGGIKDRTCFQMRNFPEVARFRSCLAGRRKEQTKQATTPTTPAIAIAEPSTDLEPDSIHSFQTFYDEESGAFKVESLGSTVAEAKVETPVPISPVPEEAEEVVTKSYAKYLNRTSLTTPPDAPETLVPKALKAPALSPRGLSDSNSSLLGPGDFEDDGSLAEESKHLEAIQVPSLRGKKMPPSIPVDSVASTQHVRNYIPQEILQDSFGSSSTSNNFQEFQDSFGSISTDTTSSSVKRVSFLDDVQNIPPARKSVPSSLKPPPAAARQHHQKRPRRRSEGSTSIVEISRLLRESRGLDHSGDQHGTLLRDFQPQKPAPAETKPPPSNKARRVSSRETERERRREQKLRAYENKKCTADCRAASSRDMPARRMNVNDGRLTRSLSPVSSRSMRDVAAIHAASLPDALGETKVIKMNEKEFQAKYGASHSKTITRKGDKGYGYDPEATETTLNDSFQNTHHNQSLSSIQSNLVEATLVDEDQYTSSSSSFKRRVARSIVASPVEVVAAEDGRMRFRMCGGMICVCSLLMTTIALVVFFSLGLGGLGLGGNDEPSMAAATEEPVGLTAEERHALLAERLRDLNYDESTLDDLLSPQRLAMQWMATADNHAESLIMEENYERLGQRYLLAVFYYQMTENVPFPHCAPAETGEDDGCIHPVLETYAHEGLYTDQHMNEPAFRWLSNVEECRWAGMKCEDGVHVSKLSLAGYGLRGSLPVEIGYLSALKVLDMQRNKLFGSLPSEWGILAKGGKSSLQSIRLDGNGLSGPIPTEWCNINTKGLQDLILSNNKLTGTIPDCLGEFSALENFSVVHNLLSGELPSSLFDLPDLRRIHLTGNKLQGKIPDSFCSAKKKDPLIEATADCDNSLSVTAFVECNCCTTCCVAGSNDEEECNSRLADYFAHKANGHH